MNDPIGDALDRARRRRWTRKEIIKELRRERKIRIPFYARKVSNGDLDADEAAKRIVILEVLIRHLQAEGPSLFSNLPNPTEPIE